MNNWRQDRKIRKRSADILMGIGHIMFGSVVVPFFFEEFDLTNAIAGLMFALAFWFFSLVLSRTRKNMNYER